MQLRRRFISPGKGSRTIAWCITVAGALLSGAAALSGQDISAPHSVNGSVGQGAVLQTQSTGDQSRMDSSGSVVPNGVASDLGRATDCAVQTAATGAATRLQWYPCKSALGFRRVPAGEASSGSANIGSTFSGGELVEAAIKSLAAPLQSRTLLQLQSGAPFTDRFRVDSSGSFVAYGFVRDVGKTTGCAAQIPATGAGTRLEWFPCRGSFRFGRVPTGQTNWDDSNMDDFTFAGGNQVTASGYGSFSFGDQVTVSSLVGVGFGSAVTVSGTAGFSAGASNVCSGFACTAIGYTNRAGGQGSVALGYRVTANNDYSVAIGYRASNNGRTGTMVLGDESTTDSVRNQADNEFRARYAGGFRFRTSVASNAAAGVSANTGCDLNAGSGTFTCSSSRKIKDLFETVNGEDILSRLRTLPVTSWHYTNEKSGVRHLGPVAEDFRAAFGLGYDSTSIGLGDIDGVNLLSVKALESRTAELKRELSAKTTALEEVKSELATLRIQHAQALERMAAVEKAVAKLVGSQSPH